MNVSIPTAGHMMRAILEPAGRGDVLAIFAHGGAGATHSGRDQAIADALRRSGVGTLLIDLLTEDEQAVDRDSERRRFEVALLVRRLVDATLWASEREAAGRAPRIGYCASGSGAAAALMAASHLGERIGAAVCRSGRPDLAGEALTAVACPTLLIVGERDPETLDANEHAYARLSCEKDLVLIPRASHDFQEHGALLQVGAIVAEWFRSHLVTPPRRDGALGARTWA